MSEETSPFQNDTVDKVMEPLYKTGLIQYGIPEHMHGGIIRWIEEGIEPGDFLTALLSNDFMEAVGRADTQNMHSLVSYAYYLYNAAPLGCFGSPELFKEWSEKGGLLGSGVKAE